MSQIKKKFIGDNEVGAAKVRLENNSSIKARNAADNADVNILKVNATDELIVEQNFIPVTPDTTKLGNDNKAFGELHVNDIKDNVGGAVIGANTRVIYDGSGNNSIDAANRQLIDSSAAEAINYETRQLKDTAGDVNLKFDTPEYIEVTNQLAIIGTAAPATLTLTNAAGANFIDIITPVSLSNWVLTLPPDDGTSGQVLQTNGGGITTWVTPSGGGSTPGHQIFTLSAGDITNGYVTLTNAPVANSVMMFVSGLKSTFTVDYTVSGSQVNFSTHTPTLVATDVVEIHYQY